MIVLSSKHFFRSHSNRLKIRSRTFFVIFFFSCLSPALQLSSYILKQGRENMSSSQRLHYHVSIESMHENTFIEICQYLAYKDVAHCLFICRSWNQLIEQSTIIWKYMYQSFYYEHYLRVLDDENDSHIHSYRNHHFSSDSLKTKFYLHWDTFFNLQRRLSSTSGIGSSYGRSMSWKESFLQVESFVRRHSPPAITQPAVTTNNEETDIIHTATPLLGSPIPSTTLLITNDNNNHHLSPQIANTVNNNAVNPPNAVQAVAHPLPSLLHAQPLHFAPVNTLVPRGGHTCHVLKSSSDDYLIVLGGDIPIDYGEFATADIISLRTGDILYTNLLILPNNISSTWLNCSVRVNNQIYLVQHDEIAVSVLRISLGKKRMLDGKILPEEHPLQNNSNNNKSPFHGMNEVSPMTRGPPRAQRGSSLILDPIPLPPATTHNTTSNKTNNNTSSFNSSSIAPTPSPHQTSATSLFFPNNTIPAPSTPQTSSTTLHPHSHAHPQSSPFSPSSSSSHTRAANNNTANHQRFRCILFGGEIENDENPDDQRFINDVYLLLIDESKPDSIQWQKVVTTGQRPCPRAAHSAILVQRKMFVFGGWTNIASTTPEQKEYATCVFDDVFLNDVYVLDIDVFHWTKIETLGIPPAPRCQSVMLSMPAFSHHHAHHAHHAHQPSSSRHNSQLSSSSSSLLSKSNGHLKGSSNNVNELSLINNTRYLLITGGGSREAQNDGALAIRNFSDYNLLDLETMCWLPISFFDDRLRNGCKAVTYYEGVTHNHPHWSNHPQNNQPSNACLSEAGWILAGGIVSHLLDPEDDATLLRDIYYLPAFK